MRTFAVVVNWNGGDENLACLRTLLDQGLAPADVAFVDNASTDGSLERVKSEFPGLRFVENRENAGYGDGTNQGLEIGLREGADLLFLVNNDIELPAGLLDGLRAELEGAPELGIVGPRVLYRDEPERVWAAGGLLTFRQNLTTLLGHRAPDGPEWRRNVDVDYVPGCAMLVRRSVLESIGLLDGTYFAYHEDVDYCLQAKLAGFGVRCVGELSALHAAHTSTGGGYNPRRKYMMGVNTIWFLRRHGTPWRWARFFVFDVLSLPLVWLLACFGGRGRAALAKGLGMWHGAAGRRVTARSIEPGATRLW